jgi:hypothetical protein
MKYRWKWFFGSLVLVTSLTGHTGVTLAVSEVAGLTARVTGNPIFVDVPISTSTDRGTSRGVLPPSSEESNGTLTPWARGAGRDIYRITFLGAELATVDVSGDGTTNLDLYVFDNQRQLVCRSAEAGDNERCAWTPHQTAEFFVEVRNHGPSPNKYRLWTN